MTQADSSNPILNAITDAQDFNPSLTHPLYEKYKSTWKLCLDMLELDAVKLAGMVEKHDGEGEKKFELRQSLAAAFNLVPSIVGMIRDYLFAEEPQIDVKKDDDLIAFVADCNGRGMTYVEFVRHKMLPLSLCMGMVDVLVQNPFVDEAPATQGDAAGIRPVVFPISPLQRINWSVRPDGSYHWVCFRDADEDDPHPLMRNVPRKVAFITVSSEFPAILASSGFWIRSWRDGGDTNADWQHEAGETPTLRVPIATLFYQESLERPHWPVSKIGMMVVLTRLMIQVLSWTTEDMLANLALLAIPTKDGQPPKGDDGKSLAVTVSASTILYFDKEANREPKWVQGAVEHIKVKLEFVSAIVGEILRLARLIGASAEAEKITSGVQGFVARNELFQELATLAGGLDACTMEVFALVKSWATGEDWTVAKLKKEIGPTVDFYKGPYTIEPLSNLIQNAERLVRLYSQGGVSPTAVKAVYAMVARSTFYASDPNLETILKELEANVGEAVDAEAAAADVGEQTEDIKKPGAQFDRPAVTTENVQTGGVV